MIIKIQDYRGWDISFNTENETFYTTSDSYDNQQTKKSYAATKKYIDDFIKDNQVFNPIWIEPKPNSYSSDGKIKLIGIRKDGRFVYEDKKGEKKQLADYNEKDYILYDESNDKYRDAAKQIDKEIEGLRIKRNAILSEIKGTEFIEYKKQFIITT